MSNETKKGVVTGDNGCHSPYDYKKYPKGYLMPVDAVDYDALIENGTITEPKGGEPELPSEEKQEQKTNEHE